MGKAVMKNGNREFIIHLVILLPLQRLLQNWPATCCITELASEMLYCSHIPSIPPNKHPVLPHQFTHWLTHCTMHVVVLNWGVKEMEFDIGHAGKTYVTLSFKCSVAM